MKIKQINFNEPIQIELLQNESANFDIAYYLYSVVISYITEYHARSYMSGSCKMLEAIHSITKLDGQYVNNPIMRETVVFSSIGLLFEEIMLSNINPLQKEPYRYISDIVNWNNMVLKKTASQTFSYRSLYGIFMSLLSTNMNRMLNTNHNIHKEYSEINYEVYCNTINYVRRLKEPAEFNYVLNIIALQSYNSCRRYKYITKNTTLYHANLLDYILMSIAINISLLPVKYKWKITNCPSDSDNSSIENIMYNLTI